MLGLFRRAMGAAFVFLALGNAASEAQSLDSLSGKTIRAIISGPPSTSTDTYGRAFLDSLKPLLPSTTILVQNMGYPVSLATAAQPEPGLITLFLTSNTPIYSQLMGKPDAPVDLADFHWIGALTDNKRVLTIRAGLGDPVPETLLALDRQPIALVPDAGNPSTVEMNILNAITDFRFRVVMGFQEPERNAMILSGNGDVVVGSYTSVLPMIQSGDLAAIARYDDQGYPEEVMALPTLRDIARADADPDLIEFLIILNRVGRSIAAAPDTPDDVVAALRAAFDQVVASPEYAARMAEQQLINSPTSGAEVQDRMGRLLASSDTIGPLLSAAVACGERVSASGTPGC